ncbi:MAG: GHKL domain-containing protein [Lachnospiraceae bacterium]|nr:GHKL domain-containing protein [Lachnospiraceae bacterium]
MWLTIYYCISALLMMLSMLLVAKYIFLERDIRYNPIFFTVSFCLIFIFYLLDWEDMAVIAPFLLTGVYIGFKRKKRRIRGFFLCIPIMGMCYGIMLPVFLIPEFEYSEMFDLGLDMVINGLLLLFLWKGKAWRERFRVEMQYRSLQKWESRLLIVVGILMWCISIPLVGEQVMATLSVEMKWYIACVSVVAVLLTITVIILVLQGNKSAYYHAVADLNEQYLNAQTQHFQAYQRAQVETRRIRHDMNNHMMCLSHLANEKDLEGIQQYLSKLGDMVAKILPEFQCGNGLIDAICNEKYHLAKMQGIQFEMNGRLPEQLDMEAVDVCTLFSNALDNGIEALQQVQEPYRTFYISVNLKNNILYLQFKNAVKNENLKKYGIRTTKGDCKNHGFGLENIRLVVGRYHGDMHIDVEKKEEISYFILDIMIFMKAEPFTTK